ncbi:hypothetical protein EIP86_001558 [Pleurotus ostreatoroseus]|nr:hypothetical protein EIP86_001558 [Pleurotus ostreatoroseus]
MDDYALSHYLNSGQVTSPAFSPADLAGGGSAMSLTEELFGDNTGIFDGDQHLGLDTEDGDEPYYDLDHATGIVPSLPHVTISDDLLTGSAQTLSSPQVNHQDSMPIQLEPRPANHRPQGAGMASTLTTAAGDGARADSGTISEPTYVRNKENDAAQEGIASGDSDESKLSSDSDSEKRATATTGSRKISRDRKGNKKKRKLTRGDQLQNNTRTRLTERAYPYLRARIACEHGFPNEELKALFTRESFADSYQDLTRLGFDLSETSANITLQEADLIEDRISQTRGELRKIACDKLPHYFVFKHVGARQKEETMASNRSLYAKLLADDAFIYEDPDNITRGNTVYRHALIEAVIQKMWFGNDADVGVKCRPFFDKDGRFPLQCVALVVTAIRFALDEWKTGERKPGRQGIKFTDKDYGAIYEDYLKSLRAWEKYTSQPGRSNATALWQKSLLENALAHAGVSVLVDDDTTRPAACLTDKIWANNDG